MLVLPGGVSLYAAANGTNSNMSSMPLQTTILGPQKPEPQHGMCKSYSVKGTRGTHSLGAGCLQHHTHNGACLTSGL